MTDLGERINRELPSVLEQAEAWIIERAMLPGRDAVLRLTETEDGGTRWEIVSHTGQVLAEIRP